MEKPDTEEMIKEMYYERINPESKRKQVKNFYLGLLIGIFLSFFAEGLIQLLSIWNEREALISNFKNATIYQQLSDFEKLTLKSSVDTANADVALFYLVIVIGLIGIVICYILYRKINKYSNVIYQKIGFNRNKDDYEFVDTVREVYTLIKNCDKFYKMRWLLKIEDTWSTKKQQGGVRITHLFFWNEWSIIEIRKNEIVISCSNSSKGESLLNYLGELFIKKQKEFKTIEGLKNLEKGDTFVLI